MRLLQIFKALADETRLKIAYSLTLEEEMCVCDVAAVIGSSVATASHHLRYLREHSLARSKRKGRMVYYSLADDHVHQIVKVAHEHAIEGDGMATVEKTEYRLENLTCASCAMKFENNVKESAVS